MVELCYSSEPDVGAWLSSVFDATQPLLEHGFGFGFSMQRDGANGLEPVLTGSRGMAINPFASSRVAAVLDRETFRTLWFPPSPVTFMTPLLTDLSRDRRDAVRQYLSDAGVTDMLGIVGYPTHETAFVLWSCVSARAQVSRKKRDVLHKLRIHLEAGLRLRARSREEAVAVFATNGRLLHRSECVGDRDLDAMCRNACTHAKLREGRHQIDQSSVLDAWRGLVNGHWSLVERTDTDGKRRYYAYANPPNAISYRALSEIESAVLDLTCKGLSGKQVAYALGVAASSVTRRIDRAASRLGFRRHVDLIQFASGILKSETFLARALPVLSKSESAILQLVREGLSNRAIARARGTSERTVANQVAALLRKTGAPTRKALLTVTAEIS